jgi:RND family efflux transporter MFP subunit
MNLKKACIIVLVILMGFVAGCGKKKKDGAVNSIKPRVSVEVVKPSVIVEKHMFTGILEAWQRADLAPAMPGRVRKIYVKEGDRVRKGQVMAVMDKTQYETLQSGFDVAKTNFERMAKLFEAKAISQSQYEQAEMQYKQAELGLKGTRENTTLTAPFSGMVTAVTREAGEIYQGMGMSMGGASGLVQIADLSRMKMDIMVSGKAVVRLSKGQEVELYLDVFPDTSFPGKIYWINPAADQMTRTFKVRVEVGNAGLQLRPGFYGKASIHVQEKEDVLTLPRSAVINGLFAFVINGENKASRRRLTTGIGNEERLEIVEGIKEGEKVVTKGNRALSEGVEVEVE